jgi:hypothetical protein
MVRRRGLALAVIVLIAGLVCANGASAGPVLDWFGCGDCPPPEYSPFRYWTPGLARVNDKCHGPWLSVQPPNRHPEITPTYAIIKYPCPAVDPVGTIITPPTPPPDSRFRY